MREMKETGIVWLPVIPSNWKVDRVKNCFAISKDLSPEDNPTVLRLARSGVQVKDVTTNEGQMAASYDNYNKVQPGDLLLNPMDLYSGANCNVSEISGVISPAYANLRPNGNVNSKFFDYYFKIQYWAMAMFAHGKGVSYDNRWTINNDSIKNYEIPVPSFDEQGIIVECINAGTKKVDALIANQEQQIEKLKAYKQSLITEVVTKGLNPDAPMKPSSVEWIGEIPESWEVYPLKLSFAFGKGLPITKADLTPTGIKVISYGQIHAKYNSTVNVDDRLYRYVSDSYLESNASSLVSKNDMIFADTSEDIEGAGNFVFIDRDDTIFAGYHTLILKSLRDADNRYLAFLFMSNLWKNQVQSLVKGIKVYSVTRSILSNTTYILPTEQEQQQIVEYLDEKCSKIDRLVEIKQQKIDKLNDYKKSLIYEYVTGKKEVI